VTRPRRAARRVVVGLAAVLAAAAAGCSGGGTPATEGSATEGSATEGPTTLGPATRDAPAVALTVSAAASLRESLTAVARGFERANPATHVTLNFGASSALAAQIVQGAPVDVFAAASPATMRTVQQAGETAAPPAVFARNRLQIVVPAANPGRVRGLPDLAREELVVGLCAPQVPCGDLARRALAAAHVVARPDTLEPDVRALLTKVRLGEVDAGLVYRTDVLAAGRAVRGLDFAGSARASTDYQVAALAGSASPAAARGFVDFLTGPSGRAALRGAGFELP
jgi:molybdate transport system substrate-binding protein